MLPRDICVLTAWQIYSTPSTRGLLQGKGDCVSPQAGMVWPLAERKLGRTSFMIKFENEGLTLVFARDI
jgi:hypothetical protein